MNMENAYDVAGQMLDVMQKHITSTADLHHVLSCFHRMIHKEMERGEDVRAEIDNYGRFFDVPLDEIIGEGPFRCP